MSRISENPSAKELIDQVRGVKSLKALFEAIPFSNHLFPGMAEALKNMPAIDETAEILLLPDRFNDTFSRHGWIAYESMSVEAMVNALTAEKESGIAIAERLLADHYDEATLGFGIMRLTGHADFRKRARLVGLAKEDYLAARYHACVPLLLSLLDGLVNDVSKHVGFFADGANMTAWDSIAAHETGLMALARIMGQGRNKTNESEISVPYRNGILHGRELAFDNKIVAAKCWAALFAVRDWAGALADGKATAKPKEEASWGQVLRQIAETSDYRKAAEAWKPRTATELRHLPHAGLPNSLPENTPERAVAEFLDNWCNRRYGPMADALYDALDRPKGKKAGMARDDFGSYIPDAYKVIAVVDRSAAMSEVEADIVLHKDGVAETTRVSVPLVYNDDSNEIAIRGHQAGNWKIYQRGFGKVIYPAWE